MIRDDNDIVDVIYTKFEPVTLLVKHNPFWFFTLALFIYLSLLCMETGYE